MTADNEKFHDMMAEILGFSATNEPDHEAIPYPVDGEIFDEVFIVKIPSDDPPWFLTEVLDQKLQHLLYEAGSHEMDETLFAEKDIITEPGLYCLKVQVFFEERRDWESSVSEFTPGLAVLEVKKV